MGGYSDAYVVGLESQVDALRIRVKTAEEQNARLQRVNAEKELVLVAALGELLDCHQAVVELAGEPFPSWKEPEIYSHNQRVQRAVDQARAALAAARGTA